MSPPSTRPLDPPRTSGARSADPAEIPSGGPRQAVAAPVEDGRRRVLVVAAELVSADELRRALDDQGGEQQLEVRVVAPALHDSVLQFWLSDADAAVARAREIQAETVTRLRVAGVAASGDTGDSDVTAAIEDALVTFPADQIVVFTHPPEDLRPHEQIEVERLRDLTRLPIELYPVASQ